MELQSGKEPPMSSPERSSNESVEGSLLMNGGRGDNPVKRSVLRFLQPNAGISYAQTQPRSKNHYLLSCEDTHNFSS